MESDKKDRRINAGALIGISALVLLFIFIFALNAGTPQDENELSFFMKNERGTYNLVEISMPEGDGPFPAVLMAHGFAGTLHSGGAKELGARLAEHGTMAIRIDFNPCLEPNMNAGRTNVYPLTQMSSDAVSALDLAVSDYRADKDRISLYGRSYGGRLMMKMANEKEGGYDYRKLALVAPAGDAVAFERYLGGKEEYARMRKEAFGSKGYSEKLGVHIVPEWFTDVEDYDPTEFGWKFGDKPVLLFYNTLDDIVYPDTSIRCAKSYRNHEIVKVTTNDGHGYEMGYKKSELKDMIMDRLVEFLAD